MWLCSSSDLLKLYEALAYDGLLINCGCMYHVFWHDTHVYRFIQVMCMDLSDGSVAITAVYTIDRCIKLMTSMIPIGFGLGCIPLIFGLGVSGVLKIIKNV